MRLRDCITASLALAVMVGCADRRPAPICPEPVQTCAGGGGMIGGFDGVDLLIVVDEASTMAEEQALLATYLPALISSLTSPAPDWPYDALENVRVAVVSSDMGIQWGGNAYSDGDGWPGTPPCTSTGNNGKFRELDGGLWAETTGETPNDSLAEQAAELTALGTEGCFLGQHLQAAIKGLGREDQSGFIRNHALLAVLVVSDQDDCSIESNELFAQPEIQETDGNRVNVACGNNPEFLYQAESIYASLVAAKNDIATAVLFAAIVGVPRDERCEGAGNEILSCLEHEDMELDQATEGDPPAYFFRPACTRNDGDDEITRARPGRRYVELALEFQNMAYVYSVCNEDWSPAMDALARMIAEQLGGYCYTKPLVWDAETRRTWCELIVWYKDADTCPWDTGDSMVPEDEWTGQDGEDHVSLYCPVPKLAAELDCADIDHEALNQEFGWYYCENLDREDYPEACEDGIDNDGDGAVDCDDEQCTDCTICGGTGVDCAKVCRYVINVTDPTRELIDGQPAVIRCPPEPATEYVDPRCVEDNKGSCNDGLDNDNDHTVDCDGIGGEEPMSGDADCCPLLTGPDGDCVLDTKVYDLCPNATPDALPDACRTALWQSGCHWAL